MDEQKSSGQLAGDKFKEGYNCAEAILRAFCDELKLNLSDDALKIATGFGGGLGQAGCMCGALTGAVMVLNLLQGRTRPDENRGPAYSGAKEFHEAFTGQFGAACCRVLNPHTFGTPEQRKQCLTITAGAAELLKKQLVAKGLSGPAQ